MREIAEELDSIPPAQDLTIEHGRKIVANLLANEYKEIGVPRKTPTPYIKPGKIKFKAGYEDVIINVPPRSRPTLEHEQIEEQVRQWAAAGKVEKSNSPFNAPVVVAPKATPPFYRIAIDYRRVNEISEPFKHPMRKLDDMAEEISRKRIKSTMDNDQAYTQIPIWKPHRGRTAFTSRGSKWHFVCFPYGLMISGDVFNDRKSKVLMHKGADVLLWLWVWTYVDDDCIGTDSVIAHIFIVVVIFDRLLIFGVTLRVPKCRWLVLEIKYGGYIIGYHTIRPNPKKAIAIQVFKTPKNMKELRNFLGVCSWTIRRFYPAYADMASQLTTAFRKPNDRRKFETVWSEFQLQKPFQELKKAAATDLVNATFDPKAKDTTLYFDWSRWAICAVLLQKGKIVRVHGKACSDAESRYSPTKGEFLAFAWSQKKNRNYLLSVDRFLAVTDHRPLLGLEKKLDINDLDPMFSVWRIETEQFRSRRTLVYVMGDKQLADPWTRLWPHKKLPSEAMHLTSVCCELKLTDGDFKPDADDHKMFKEVQLRGVKLKFEDDRVKAFIHSQWRTFVPKRNRARLLYNVHVPGHHGLNKMKQLLSSFYIPRKTQLIKDFLRSCSCSCEKSDGNPTMESHKSKLRKTIVARKAFDVVQIDVYDYDGHHYLTGIDVFSNKAFVQRICKIGSGKKNSRHYMNKLFEAYMRMESSFGKIPVTIACDNESTLVQLPHSNKRTSCVDHPQEQGKIERFHKELGKLARIHKKPPDMVVPHYNASLAPSSGGGGDAKAVSHVFSNDAAQDSEETESDASVVDYDGRVLDIGTLVYLRVSNRSRMKKDPFWHRISKVIARVGDKSYLVHHGDGKVTKRHLTKLKIFSLGEDLIRTSLRVNPRVIQDAFDYFDGDYTPVDVELENFQPFPNDLDAKRVWIGYPGLDQMETVAGHIKTGKFEEAYLIAPEAQCEPWYPILDKLKRKHEWFGVDPDEGHGFWISIGDDDGGPHEKVFAPPITWWIIKFTGANVPNSNVVLSRCVFRARV